MAVLSGHMVSRWSVGNAATPTLGLGAEQLLQADIRNRKLHNHSYNQGMVKSGLSGNQICPFQIFFFEKIYFKNISYEEKKILIFNAIITYQ